MTALSRITLRAAIEIERIMSTLPAGELRTIELRRVVRAVVEEAVYTLPAGEMVSLLDDRARFARDAALQGRAA